MTSEPVTRTEWAVRHDTEVPWESILPCPSEEFACWRHDRLEQLGYSATIVHRDVTVTYGEWTEVE